MCVGAVFEQTTRQRGDAFLAWRLLHCRHLAHATEDRDGVADMLGLDDQPQSIGQHTDVGRVAGVRHVRRRQCRGRPSWQRYGVVRWGIEGFDAAKA